MNPAHGMFAKQRCSEPREQREVNGPDGDIEEDLLKEEGLEGDILKGL